MLLIQDESRLSGLKADEYISLFTKYYNYEITLMFAAVLNLSQLALMMT